jgi:hypothetical protein
VLFESNGATRTYVLNRASKLNALNSDMLKLMRPQLEVRGPECGNADSYKDYPYSSNGQNPIYAKSSSGRVSAVHFVQAVMLQVRFNV